MKKVGRKGLMQITYPTSYDEIKEAYEGEKDGRIKVRLLIILKTIKKKSSSYDIAEEVNTSHTKVQRWIKRFNKKGIKGLYDKEKSGRPPELTETQLMKLEKIIDNPGEFRAGFNSIEILHKIKTNFGVTYTLRHVRRLLHKRGYNRITPRPSHIKKDHTKGEVIVEELKKKLASLDKGWVVFSQDEFSVSLKIDGSKIWAKRGCKPIFPVKPRDGEIHIFGALHNAKGKVMTLSTEKKNRYTFLKFLKKLLRYYKKVFVVIDNAPYHHAKIVREFIEENKHRLIVEYLPPYSPEYNPSEQCWREVKKDLITTKLFLSKISMEEQILDYFKKKHFFGLKLERFLSP